MSKDYYYQLAPNLKICRIVNGMWQVAGGHGYIDSESAMEDMMKYHEAGFTSWDLADIYGPAEDFIGEFRHSLSEIKGEEELLKIQALTKWVPQPRTITRSIVNENIDRSCHRMGDVNSLDLLQFHWWDYNNSYYMDALKYLSDLHDQGIIQNIGLTNFDTERMQIIIDSDLQIVSNQVQYSIIVRRPEVKMIPLCKRNNIGLLAYGSLCGGLMSEGYVGIQEPFAAELTTLSLRKYKKMIDKWGGWNLFQELLSTLNRIAQKYNVSIANVATRYILDKPAVAGVIIGVRLGIINHRDNNMQAFDFSLDKLDYDDIDAVCSKSNNLFNMIGDCGDEYR